MAHLAAGAAGAADPQVVALIQGIGDERVVVGAATTRFAAPAAKSDALADDDNSAGAKRAREAARDEDARLQAASVRLENARETLAKFGSSQTIGLRGPPGTTDRAFGRGRRARPGGKGFSAGGQEEAGRPEWVVGRRR